MRKICLGLAAIVLAGILSGCGDSEKTESFTILEDSVQKEEIITLEVFAWDDEETNLRLFAEAYSEQNPNIRISLNVIPSSEYSQQMMAIKKGSKQGDCIFFPNLPEAAVWIEKGILQDLEPWKDSGENEMNFTDWYQGDENEYSKFMFP